MLGRGSDRSRAWTALFLAAACACGSPERRAGAELAPLAPAQAPLASTPPRVPAEPHAPTEAAGGAPSSNRDPHGNPDLGKYIATLQSPERVGHLQVDLVLEKLALPEDAVVGDLGCGPGIFALAFSKACPNGVVYACDLEPGQLDQVREKIRVQGARNVVPILASADDPHFPPGRLDLVFIGDTYHHLDDRVAYLRRLQSALEPGGRLALLEYKPGDLPVGPPADHKLPQGVMQAELGEAGYVRVERYDTHPWHDFEIWRIREAPEERR